MDDKLDEFLAGLRVKRDPYVAIHKEPSLFFINVPISITRGFLNSLVAQSFGQLAQSGLYKLWQDLENTAARTTRIKRQTNEEVYRKVILTTLFGTKKV